MSWETAARALDLDKAGSAGRADCLWQAARHGGRTAEAGDALLVCGRESVLAAMELDDRSYVSPLFALSQATLT